MRRKSSAASSSTLVTAPVRKPRPSGLYGTMPMPSSRHVGTISASSSRGEQRPLALQRGDRVHRMGAPDRVGRRLGDAEVADLAGRDELAHRPERLLDRDGRVGPMEVVEVDPVGAEATERRVARGPHVVGAPIGGSDAVADDDAELGREHHLVAVAGDGLADQLLVGAQAVHVGGVEERHAELARTLEGGERFVAVDGSVGEAHPHAAQPLGGDGERAEVAGGQRHAATVGLGRTDRHPATRTVIG